MPNPFFFGGHVTDPEKFIGRKAELRRIASLLETAYTGQIQSVSIIGERRIGKSSLLYHLKQTYSQWLSKSKCYCFAYIDLQSARHDTLSDLLNGILKELLACAHPADRAGENALKRLRASSSNDPLTLDHFEKALATLSGELHLCPVICLDEFERLEEMVRDGRLDRRAFNWLRGMIQHHASVVVLLSGSHEPFELEPVWSDTLINVRTLRVGPLEEKEARELITAPVPDFPLKYEPEAVERILAASGRQPYLIQATCRDLVDKLNEEQRLYAGVADVERALESCLQTAQVYFVELWKSADTDDAQRRVMLALAQAGGRLPEADLARKAGEASLAQALRRLERRDIIERTDAGYCFHADLVRQWVLQNSGR